MKNNTKHIKNLFEIDEWSLIRKKFYSNEKEFLIAESLMSQGNGFFGSRGNFEETYTGHTYKGVYNAGVWFPCASSLPSSSKDGCHFYNGQIINSLNFLPIRVFINDIELDLNVYPPKSYRQELNMKTGLMTRDFIVKVKDIEVKCHTERFYSIYDNEIACLKYSVKPNKHCTIKFVSKIDGNVYNQTIAKERFWVPFDSNVGEGHIFTGIKTKENSFNVDRYVVFAVAKHFCKAHKSSKGYNEWSSWETFEKLVEEASTFEITKNVCVLSTRHHVESKIKVQAIKKVEKISNLFYGEEKKMNERKWQERWDVADIKIKGDLKSQQAIRFSLFQLFSTYHGEDANLNINSKGFTSEKFGGTYWYSEAYCLPVYLSICEPIVAKSLLSYRYHHLHKAIENAKTIGLEGALYPVVTFNGDESYHEWEITFEEIHRNGMIAYAIFQYFNYTKDIDFLKDKGIKILLEIAKFFASRVHYCKNKKAYMIHGVTGPNEFENNVNNNWYTNKLAQWVLTYALSVIENYNIKVSKYKIKHDVLDKWKDIIKKMYFRYDKDLKIFVQDDSFLDKEFIEVKDLSPKVLPITEHWSWDKILRSCFIKQADVLHGIYLFQESFKLEDINSNYDFYSKYTVHESSLSPCIHSILACKLNKMEQAYDLSQRLLQMDLSNYNNETQNGLHITSMAGSWLTVIEGFGGMRVYNGHLMLNPKLPMQWESLNFNLRFQERIINVDINKEKENITLDLVDGKPLELLIYEKRYNLENNISIKLQNNWVKL